jgi:hypothetical protein
MTKHTTQIIDTIFFALSGLFFFGMFFFYADLPSQPAPATSVILLFLSVACFGMAGYRVREVGK